MKIPLSIKLRVFFFRSAIYKGRVIQEKLFYALIKSFFNLLMLFGGFIYVGYLVGNLLEDMGIHTRPIIQTLLGILFWIIVNVLYLKYMPIVIEPLPEELANK